jgi:hypothetical protein
MEAGGLESGTGNELGEGVEEEQVGLELPDFFGDGGAFAAFAFDERAPGLIGRRGRRGFGAGAEVVTLDAPIDAPGAGVITSAIAGFPGHEKKKGLWGGEKRRRRVKRHTTPRTRAARADDPEEA